MKVKCLSVKNPISYLICAGIKDVENRSWNTEYRGTVFIHSSGADAFHINIPEWYEILPLQKELNSIQFDDNDNLISESHYIGYDKNNDRLFLTAEGEKHRAEYELSKLYQAGLDTDQPYFKAQAIIGTVDITDVVKDSSSKFAEPGAYHWILSKPRLFEKPILHVKGRLRFFDYTISDNPITVIKTTGTA
ncbi:MAG: ASCH domain-containing protein [Spirochaetes bacterium]|jgi:hypothetical protein|nr:ASCH domain-containing protein [Spirochaetota bacterium]